MTADNSTLPDVLVMGAGAIGLYVGGVLAASGAPVAFCGREDTVSELKRDGLTITRHDGFAATVPAGSIVASTDPAVGAGARIVLFCVKSGDTEQAATALAPHLAADATVFSLQNGVGNVAVLEQALPGRAIVAAVIPFNVARRGPAAVHCAMDGAVLIGPAPRAPDLAAALRAAGAAAQIRDDIEAVQWGKLLLNLNNGLNALSGVPLRQQLEDRGQRRFLAAAIAEALSVLDAAGIAPAAAAGRTGPRLIPYVLCLPNWLFRLVARAQMTIDPSARSSTWDDLQAARRPETPFLNGAIVAKARGQGMDAPVNAFICEQVDMAFAAGTSPRLDGAALWARYRDRMGASPH